MFVLLSLTHICSFFSMERQQQSHQQQRNQSQQRSSREEKQTDAAKTDIKLSSTVAADETTDKRSTGINEVLLIKDVPYEPIITYSDVTRRIGKALHIWMIEFIILLVCTVDFRNWRLCTPINLRKSQKLKKAKGNVSSNMGKMLCGVYLFMITLVLVSDPHAAMSWRWIRCHPLRLCPLQRG